jgi:hypothetical protein
MQIFLARNIISLDYAIENEAAWERVKEFKVGERVDSDHLPLEITI